jgi:thiamine-phosphate pyrophosphorylase
VEAGADFLAVSGAVWGTDEAQAVKAFARRLAGTELKA